MALISVVIPVHDRADTVRRAIESVLCQAGVDLELLVIDDGSSDDSPEIIRSIEDDRMRVFTRSVASGGPAIPRTLGISHARGEWIALLDDDDYWLQGKLAAQLHAATETEADVVYSRCLVADHRSPEQLVDYHRRFELLDGDLPSGDVAARLIEKNFVPTLTTLLRRERVGPVGSFNPARSGVDDYDLWLRLALAGCRFTAIKEATAVYSWSPESLSQHIHRYQLHVEMFRDLAEEHPGHRTALTARLQRAHRAQARRQVGAASRHLRAVGGRGVSGRARLTHLRGAAGLIGSAAVHQATAIRLRP